MLGACAGGFAGGTSAGGAAKGVSVVVAGMKEVSVAALRLGRLAFGWLGPLRGRVPAVGTLLVAVDFFELSRVAAFLLDRARTFAAPVVAEGFGPLLRPSVAFLFAIFCITHIAAHGAVYRVHTFNGRC